MGPACRALLTGEPAAWVNRGSTPLNLHPEGLGGIGASRAPWPCRGLGLSASATARRVEVLSRTRRATMLQAVVVLVAIGLVVAALRLQRVVVTRLSARGALPPWTPRRDARRGRLLDCSRRIVRDHARRTIENRGGGGPGDPHGRRRAPAGERDAAVPRGAAGACAGGRGGVHGDAPRADAAGATGSRGDGPRRAGAAAAAAPGRGAAGGAGAESRGAGARAGRGGHAGLRALDTAAQGRGTIVVGMPSAVLPVPGSAPERPGRSESTGG